MATAGNAGSAQEAPRTLPPKHPEQVRAERAVLAAAALFALTGLMLQWWRLQVLTASYDQGIFLQAIWSGLHGHPFESTLSSQLSTNVIHAGEPPAVGYHRLGQHFTPVLLLWVPLVGLLGIWALPLVQVGLMTAAGLVLHLIARKRLEDPWLAAFLACSFFGANAVIGPTWGNFTDLAQLPLAVLLLWYGLQRRLWWLLALAAVAVPMIREDTGVLLVGVSLWILVRQRQRWPLALALAALGLGWVLLVTNVLMPLFSDDNSRRFMVENFGQYIGDADQASSLEVLLKALRQPLVVLRELIWPPGETLRYLLAQGLPLMLVPLISLDSWLLMGMPLMGLLLAQGANNPLSINLRYALLVVPGLFAGAIEWWGRHPKAFAHRRLRRVWAGCIVLSLLLTLLANPNRSLSFLIPDSVDPWVYSSPALQWSHGASARELLRQIPKGASVAATTTLIPHLAQRPVLIRFPNGVIYRDRQGDNRAVDWIAIDLDWLRRYGVAFPRDREALENSLEALGSLPEPYGVRAFADGVVLLQRNQPDLQPARGQLQELMSSIQLQLDRQPE
ncbi:DUF2079 domain-containing protein [Synechococcus sp. RedBA-s]|uniref:DUF2079 domain-containing protein n=1 Tax=Synechococcus sp. RedBA-s TaxID=2823741 RepID=UPI0028F4327D|nr:DUF2079 domain-containing protein [Synechococcus sp. RedBA-s]